MKASHSRDKDMKFTNVLIKAYQYCVSHRLKVTGALTMIQITIKTVIEIAHDDNK